jgi:hypothetical protein
MGKRLFVFFGFGFAFFSFSFASPLLLLSVCRRELPVSLLFTNMPV